MVSKMIEKKVENCQITIVSVADGRENITVCKGICSQEEDRITLAYTEHAAEILLVFDKDVVKIERKGDYSLSLSLKENEYTTGVLGISGREGPISTYTHKLAYSSNKRSVLAIIHYDLRFTTERQEMKLRISVKRI